MPCPMPDRVKAFSYTTLLAIIGLELGDRSRTILFQSFIESKVQVPYTPCGVDGAHDPWGNSTNTDPIQQTRGIPHG